MIPIIDSLETAIDPIYSIDCECPIPPELREAVMSQFASVAMPDGDSPICVDEGVQDLVIKPNCQTLHRTNICIGLR